MVIEYRLAKLGVSDVLNVNQDAYGQSKTARISPATSDELGQLRLRLEDTGYSESRSGSWLEHYNAACIFALRLSADSSKAKDARLSTRNDQFAYAAVGALRRALESGEDVDFARTKSYWLQAGDPDLAALREYECFRAFEASVYGRPLPAFVDVSKYELYSYLRSGIKGGARQLGIQWLDRAISCPEPDARTFESWWWQERRAWQVVIRLGRFYRQWQTRYGTQDVLRSWIETLVDGSLPSPYPNLSQSSYKWDSSNIDATRAAFAETEDMFAVLAMNNDSAVDTNTTMRRLYRKTELWGEYAVAGSVTRPSGFAESGTIRAMCVQRCAVWMALRNWADYPSIERQHVFTKAVDELNAPPENPIA